MLQVKVSYTAEAGLKLIFLPAIPECRDYRLKLIHQARISKLLYPKASDRQARAAASLCEIRKGI